MEEKKVSWITYTVALEYKRTKFTKGANSFTYMNIKRFSNYTEFK